MRSILGALTTRCTLVVRFHDLHAFERLGATRKPQVPRMLPQLCQHWICWNKVLQLCFSAFSAEIVQQSASAVQVHDHCCHTLPKSWWVVSSSGATPQEMPPLNFLRATCFWLLPCVNPLCHFPHQDMALRGKKKQFEVLWRGAKSYGSSADVLTGNFASGGHSYGCS